MKFEFLGYVVTVSRANWEDEIVNQVNHRYPKNEPNDFKGKIERIKIVRRLSHDVFPKELYGPFNSVSLTLAKEFVERHWGR